MSLYIENYGDLREYKQRYIREYVELEQRCEKLQAMLRDYAFHRLQYTPSNSFELSAQQYAAMQQYKATLWCRMLFVLGEKYQWYIDDYKQHYTTKVTEVIKLNRN